MFVLVEGNRQAFLGLKTCDQIGLIKRVHVIDTDKMTAHGQNENTEVTTSRTKQTDRVKENKYVFKGIGCLPGKHKVRLKNNVEPVIQPARTVALKKRLRNKLHSDSRRRCLEN